MSPYTLPSGLLSNYLTDSTVPLTIQLHWPKIILELAPYVYDKNPKEFVEMLTFFWDNQYELFNINTMAHLPKSALEIQKSIPAMGGINAICIPKPKDQNQINP